MSFRRTAAFLILLNFAAAMVGLGVLQYTNKHAKPVKHHLTHQERLAARPGPVRFAIMDDYVRDTLAADWDKHANDSTLLERGFCLKWQYDIWAGEKAYRVTQIARPNSVNATVDEIGFRCPVNAVEIHIHPAQTCLNSSGLADSCWRGGPYAYQCLPSDQDRAYLAGHLEQAFAMVQCSREGVVAYFRPDPPQFTLPPFVFTPNYGPPNIAP